MTQYFGDGKNKYAINKLWRLVDSLAIESIPLTALVQNATGAAWEDGLTPLFLVTAIQKGFYDVLHAYIHHIERMDRADEKYPILVTTEMWIIDGVHRYAKALKNNKKEVNITVVPQFILDKAIME